MPLALLFSSNCSLFFSTFVLGGGGSVVIVRIRVYTSNIVIGTGIIYCTRSGSQTVVQGRLATSCCRRGRLPPDGWWPFAVAGGS